MSVLAVSLDVLLTPSALTLRAPSRANVEITMLEMESSVPVSLWKYLQIQQHIDHASLSVPKQFLAILAHFLWYFVYYTGLLHYNVMLYCCCVTVKSGCIHLYKYTLVYTIVHVYKCIIVCMYNYNYTCILGDLVVKLSGLCTISFWVLFPEQNIGSSICMLSLLLLVLAGALRYTHVLLAT